MKEGMQMKEEGSAYSRPVVNMGEQLSEHFTLGELCRSQTAERHGVPNIPLKVHITKLRNLCEKVLEPVRQHFGEPLYVNSGYRCEYVNKLVGGVPYSQHMKGEAADVTVHSLDVAKRLRTYFDWMREHVPYDQLILERKGNVWWIHVSCRLDTRQNRRQVMMKVIPTPAAK